MLSERAEDYLEAIYIIHSKKGYVRVTDIADILNIKCPSVVEMLRKLKNLHLIFYEKYSIIFLTEKGLGIAKNIKDRHDTLIKLLMLAGVPYDIANKDACIMEHKLSQESLKQLKKLVNNLKNQEDKKM